MTAAGWMSPLARAERMLTTRLLHLERQLPDDPEAPAWDRYVSTVMALTRVLDRIRPLGCRAADDDASAGTAAQEANSYQVL